MSTIFFNITQLCDWLHPYMNDLDIGIIIDCLVSISADQRAHVIEQVCKLINPQMRVNDILGIIEGIANNLNPQQDVDVHQGNRDQRVRVGIELLWQHQGEITKVRIDKAVEDFNQYLNDHQMNDQDKELAHRALLAPRDANKEFGPLISEVDFSVLGLVISGKELIGRLWIFASEIQEPDQINAKDSIIFPLKNSYEMQSRVCNQGKTQRLIVAVVQWRLLGVDIELTEEMKINKFQGIEMFFNIQAHQNIDDLATLLNAANQFCNESPALDRDEFLLEIRSYAENQGFE
jgi:hypothetical protein